MTGSTTDKDNVSEVAPEEEEPEVLAGATIVLHCVFKNDLTRLQDCFDNVENPFNETILDLINKRDENGKSPLDIAATLGRIDITKELITRGADVTLVTEKGVKIKIQNLFPCFIHKCC